MKRFCQVFHIAFTTGIKVLAAEVDLRVDPVFDHKVDPVPEHGIGDIDLMIDIQIPHE